MKISLGLRLLVCFAFLLFSLYSYVDLSVELMRWKMEIPIMSKELYALQQANARLEYEVECFENPVNLLQIARTPQFGHLSFPKMGEIHTLGSLSIKSKNHGVEDALRPSHEKVVGHHP